MPPADRQRYLGDRTPAQGGRYFAGRYSVRGGPDARYTGAPVAPKKDTGPGGALGFVENLGTDAKDALLGLPMGLVQTVTHPVETAKAIGKSYEQTYGPLTHGDVSGFLHNLYSHPLGPILDATTLVTGGAGAAARLGGALSKAGVVADTSRLAKLGEAGTIELRSPAALADAGKLKAGDHFAAEGQQSVEKVTSKNPVRRGVQTTIDRALKMTPATTPIIGEARRFARELEHARNSKIAALKVQARDFEQAVSKLHAPRDQFAVALHIQGDSPAGWAKLLETEHADAMPPQVEKTLTLLRDPKTIDAFANPSEKVQRAAALGRELAASMTATRIENVKAAAAEQIKALDKTDKRYAERRAAIEQHAAEAVQSIHERPYLNLRLQSGARFTTPIKSEALTNARAQAARLEKRHQMAIDNATKKMTADEMVQFATPQSPTVSRLGGAVSVAKDRVQQLEDRLAADHGITVDELRRREALTSPTLEGGKSIEDLRAQLAAEGRPEPAYFPHKPIVEKAGLAKAGRGIGAPAAEAALKHNQGILYMTARVAQDPSILSAGYLAYVRTVAHQAVHDELEAHAVRIPVGEGAPEGWVFIRRKGEKIPFTEKVQGDVMQRLNELVPKENAYGELVTASEAEAAGDGAYRLVVPESFAKAMAGEFARSTSAIRVLWEKPVAVWRAIVLGLRPGFFTNNVVGNHLMLALRFAGPNGASAYLRVLGEMRGATAVKRLLGREMHDVRSIDALGKTHLQALVQEHAPELLQGTFGRSQFPTSLPGGAVGQKAAKLLSEGVGPLTAKVAEDVPRRVGFVAAITPAVRAAMKADGRTFLERLHPDTETFAHYANQALEANPQLAKEAISRVNGALGDYLNLSELERGTVRSLIPFYAWLKVITTVIARAAVETPGRSAVLTRLGQIGAEMTQQQLGVLPEFLQGAIPLGPVENGHAPILTTGGLNPFASGVDVGHAIAALVSGKPGESGKAIGTQLNPLVQTLIETLSGKDLLTGAPAKGVPGGVAGNLAYGPAAALPPTRLVQALTGHEYRSPDTLYGRGAGEALLAFLGVPKKNLNVNRAHDLGSK